MKRCRATFILGILALCAASLVCAQEDDELSGSHGVSAQPVEQDVRSDEGKNAKLAIGASLAFPALGQLYNEEGVKTLVVFLWESYYIATILREGQRADFYKRKAVALETGETWRGMNSAELRLRFERHQTKETNYIWYGSALLIASVLDAYVFANLYRHETDEIRGKRAQILPHVDMDEVSFGLQVRIAF